MNKLWTEEENAILREIWESDKTIKAEAHRLPERSLVAIKQALFHAGWGRKKRGDTSFVWPMIIRELERSPGLTARELEKKLGTGYRNIIDQLIARSKWDEKPVYVSGWKRANSLYVQRWSVGNMPDALRPPRQSAEERRQLDRAYQMRRTGKVNPFAIVMQQVTNPTVVTLSSRGRYEKR